MKKSFKQEFGMRPVNLVKGLASAAVILSLTACDADALDGLLADGETLNIGVSQNDDGDIVIDLDNDQDNEDADDEGNDDALDLDDDADGDSAPVAAPSGGITVTLTNTSISQPMTPPIVVLHNAPDADLGMRLFHGGQPAIDQVIEIAENGNNAPMVQLLGYLLDQGRASEFGVGFADPENPGPLLPGMTATVNLDATADDQVLSLVSMVVCTNDGFSGADAHVLSNDTTETFMAPIYDAGSETNVLMLDYWVPPCGTDANITDDENGSVTLHPGQSGSENPVFDFEAGTRYLEVTITRN